jgi:uncharacterized protein YjbJ (UPF0337 family)
MVLAGEARCKSANKECIFNNLIGIFRNGLKFANESAWGINVPGDSQRERSMHRGIELLSGGGEMVDKDRAKGAINEIAGRARRQVGEWTGDADTQIEGLAQEVKGKAQKTWGGVKGAVRAARDEVRKEQDRSNAEGH